MDSIVSMAHMWRTHPSCAKNATSWPAKHMVQCTECGAMTIIGQWNIPRCVPKLAFANSGFVDETVEAKRLIQRLTFHVVR